MVGTLCRDPRLPFAAAIGTQCEAQGTAYIVFAFWVASIIQSCLVYNLFRLVPFASPELAQNQAPSHLSPSKVDAHQDLEQPPANQKQDADFDFAGEVARLNTELTQIEHQGARSHRQQMMQQLESLAYRVSMEVDDDAQMRLKPLRKLQDQLKIPSSPVAEHPDEELGIGTNGSISPHVVQPPANGSQLRSEQLDVSKLQSGRHVAQLLGRQPAAKGAETQRLAVRSSDKAHVELQPLAAQQPSEMGSSVGKFYSPCNHPGLDMDPWCRPEQ